MQATASSRPRRFSPAIARGALPLGALALAVTGCRPVDPDQARICRIAAVGIEAPGSRIGVRRTSPAEAGVEIGYEFRDGAREAHRLVCRFGPASRSDLVGLARDGREVAGATVYLLRHYFIETPEGVAADPGPSP